MPVTNVRIAANSESYQINWSGDTWVRTIGRRFILEATAAEREAEIMNLLAAGVLVDSSNPVRQFFYFFTPGRPHPIENNCLLRRMDLRCVDGSAGRVWELDCEWQTPEFGEIPNADPLARPPEIVWSSETQLEDIFMDLSIPPRPITNSAGETFATQPQAQRTSLSVTYTRNEAAPNFATITTYQDAVNSASFTLGGVTIPARTALLTISPGQLTTENGVSYYPVTYTFKLQAGEWRKTLLDVGFTERVGATRRVIADTDGMEIQRPWPLNGAGVRTPNPTDTPASLTFRFYVERDFSVFNFT